MRFRSHARNADGAVRGRQAQGLGGGVSSTGYSSQLGYSNFSGLSGGGLHLGGLDAMAGMPFGGAGDLTGALGGNGGPSNILGVTPQQQREMGMNQGTGGGLGGLSSNGGVTSAASGSPGISASASAAAAASSTAEALLSLSTLSLGPGLSSAADGMMHPAASNSLQVTLAVFPSPPVRT